MQKVKVKVLLSEFQGLLGNKNKYWRSTRSLTDLEISLAVLVFFAMFEFVF